MPDNDAQNKRSTAATLTEQLAAIQSQRTAARRRRYSRSRLDRHRADIEALAEQGASWADIALWLRQYKRIKVHPTTVGRRLARWRERTAG